MSNAGRPTKYNPDYHPQAAYELALLGEIDEGIAKEFDIAVSTLNEWKKKHPKFSESLKSGKKPANAKVAKGLFKRATGCTVREETETIVDGKVVSKTVKTKEIPPDTKAGEIWLNNREGDKWAGGNDRGINLINNVQIIQVSETDDSLEGFVSHAKQVSSEEADAEQKFKALLEEPKEETEEDDEE